MQQSYTVWYMGKQQKKPLYEVFTRLKRIIHSENMKNAYREIIIEKMGTKNIPIS